MESIVHAEDTEGTSGGAAPGFWVQTADNDLQVLSGELMQSWDHSQNKPWNPKLSMRVRIHVRSRWGLVLGRNEPNKRNWNLRKWPQRSSPPPVPVVEKQAAAKPFATSNLLINAYVFIQIINIMKSVLSQIIRTIIKKHHSMSSTQYLIILWPTSLSNQC